MKRFSEKVKDIVEVRPFGHLSDLAADPVLTLGGYHFTDITADLMAKWIGRLADIKAGAGAAAALAGFRGVGKSHFLAAVGAVAAKPELRSQITDAHVATYAQQLSRRHYPLVFVRRGSGDSLLTELKKALASIFGGDPASLTDSLDELLGTASEKAGDVALVLLIDTAAGRETRVARDDGPLLGEIAEIAKRLGIFVGLALDDDISGADGPNSSISTNFAIDYLDQEHLYKIVDTHIFAKQEAMRPLLRDIYAEYRAALPGFRWSEQRFTSLYPLHPATLEIAPLIRLYIQDFALLGFASDAGVHILGRPANSLIGLDEMFDAVESKLRHVTYLTEAFAAFDRIDHECVAKTAVKTRLQAKLILKGLFLLSLDGQGASAADIAAAMMILDNGTVIDVNGVLASFSDAFPAVVDRAGNGKYLFRIEGKDQLGTALAKLAPGVPDEAIWDLLLRHMADKFSDMDTPGEAGISVCNVEWRGGIRRGEILWNSGDEAVTGKDHLDWLIVGGNTPPDPALAGHPAMLHWRHGSLTDDEKNTIRRFHVLQTDGGVREQFKDSIATAAQIYLIAVEKIWRRVFLHDARLAGCASEYEFPENSASAHTLAQLFTDALAPFFDASYPAHPEFQVALGLKETTELIASFFGAASPSANATQGLAEHIAVPLGLAIAHDAVFVPASADALHGLDVIKHAFPEQKANGEVVPTADVSRRLGAAPFGLTREAQHLILAALVSQRQLEFVTSTGNRINHRSLDLQILWDDIIGIAKPAEQKFSAERMLFWAKTLTGNQELTSLERSEDRLQVIDALTDWLAGWKTNGVIEAFDALPDDALNIAAWRAAAGVRKSFAAAAEAVDSLIANDTSLDECLQTIADLFSDQEAEFEKRWADLNALDRFIDEDKLRAEIVKYLSACEFTADVETESLRGELIGAIYDRPDELATLWPQFKERYSALYVRKHDEVIESFTLGRSLNEILSSELWAAFDSLSASHLVGQRFNTKARDIIREARLVRCKGVAVKELESRPFCTCNYGFADLERLAGLNNELRTVIDRGLESFRTKLARVEKDDSANKSLRELASRIAAGADLSSLTAADLELLGLAGDIEADDDISSVLDDLFPTAANGAGESSSQFAR